MITNNLPRITQQRGGNLTRSCAHLLAVLQDLDLVGGAGGLVVEVGRPLAAAAEVLVVEQAVDGVALFRRAHHGHHRVVPLALRGRGLKERRFRILKLAPSCKK